MIMNYSIDKINTGSSTIRKITSWLMNSYSAKLAESVSLYYFTEQILAAASDFFQTLSKQEKESLIKDGIITLNGAITKPNGFYFLLQVIYYTTQHEQFKKYLKAG
jgi:hypothetical protein